MTVAAAPASAPEPMSTASTPVTAPAAPVVAAKADAAPGPDAWATKPGRPPPPRSLPPLRTPELARRARAPVGERARVGVASASCSPETCERTGRGGAGGSARRPTGRHHRARDPHTQPSSRHRRGSCRQRARGGRRRPHLRLRRRRLRPTAAVPGPPRRLRSSSAPEPRAAPAASAPRSPAAARTSRRPHRDGSRSSGCRAASPKNAGAPKPTRSLHVAPATTAAAFEHRALPSSRRPRRAPSPPRPWSRLASCRHQPEGCQRTHADPFTPRGFCRNGGGVRHRARHRAAGCAARRHHRDRDRPLGPGAPATPRPQVSRRSPTRRPRSGRPTRLMRRTIRTRRARSPPSL